MRLAPCLLAVVLSSAAIAAPQVTPPPDEWVTIGRSPQGTQYDVLKSSIEADVSSLSVQFVLRTTYKEPRLSNGDKGNTNRVLGRTFVELGIVACREELFVTANQLVYTEKGEHVGTHARAFVYPNPGYRGATVTEILRWACAGFTRREPAPKPVTPDTTLEGGTRI